MASITKAVIGEQDLQKWDGVTSTFTRDTSTGSTLTLRKIGGEVDALAVYGAGVAFTNATITSALTAIGTTNKVSLVLVPGTWVISANVNWSAYTNVTFKILPGALLSHGAFTVNIPNVEAGDYPVFTGAGTVTISGANTKLNSIWFGDNQAGYLLALTALGGMSGSSLLKKPSSSYNYEAGALAVENYYYEQTSPITVGAGKTNNLYRYKIDTSVDAGGVFACHHFFLRSKATSNVTSNMYGVIGVAYNAGPGTVKALYGRVEAEAGCTGDTVGIVTGVVTVAGMGNSVGMQMGIDSDDGLPGGYNYGIYIHQAATAALGELGYGLIFDDIKITAGGAFIQANAVGGGDFLRLKNAAKDADLFIIDSSGDLATDLATTAETSIQFVNATRNYELQAVNTGDYFRILVSGVGNGFILDHHMNTGLSGYAGNFSDGTKILGLAQVGVAPTGNPVGGVFIYWDGTNIKLRKEDGTVQTVTVT